jgi:hypothetical protein
MAFNIDENTPEWEVNKKGTLLMFERTLTDSFRTRVEDYRGWFLPNFLITTLFRCIWDNYKKQSGATEHSLVFRRLHGWQRTVHWSILAGYSGVYEAVARELRFMIEDITQAIYIDQIMGDSEIMAKVRALSILDDGHLGFQKLVKRISILDYLKNRLKELYNEMNKYVHPSFERIQQGLMELKIGFNYDLSKFEIAKKMHIETYDVIIALILSCFPDSVVCFLRTGIGRTLEDQIGDLESDGFILTTRICRSLLQKVDH